MFHAYRVKNKLHLIVPTQWGSVLFTRSFTVRGWGPWVDTRDGASAARIPDKYSTAELVKVLRGLFRGNPSSLWLAVAEAVALQAEIESDERERLDELVAVYIELIRSSIKRIRRRGRTYASRDWLRRLAEQKAIDAKKADKSRALSFALDEVTYRGFEIKS